MKKINIQKILVPVDFSHNSMNALQTAVAIAKRHEARLHLVYVTDVDYELFPEDEHVTPRRLYDYVKTLRQLAHSVKKSDGISCDYTTITGAVTNSILKTAMSEQCDIIVMGKNGHSDQRMNFAGSHAYQVIKKSKIPVLLIPAGKTWEHFRNILFPSRPVLSVPEKYDAIRNIVFKNDATLHILNLRNPDYINELHIISRLTQILKTRMEEDKVKHTIDYYFKDDKFVDHIINTIKENESAYDLVVITAEIDTTIRDFYLGDYAQQMIHQTRTPLLILRPDSANLSKKEVLQKLEKEVALT